MSKTLLKYARTSSVMLIQINYGDEKFRFNLNKEAKITEVNLQKDLMTQPRAYAFLTMLHKRLLKILASKKIDEKKAFAKAYLKHKEALSKITHRPNSDDVARAKAELDINYLKAQREVINTNADVNNIEACVRTFEQRSSLLQTLSANRRKEQN